MPSRSAPKTVVVIGAGLTGLTAGHCLNRLGYRVRVLERSERPGGVIRSIQEEGFLVEGGPNVLSVDEPALLEFLRENRSRVRGRRGLARRPATLHRPPRSTRARAHVAVFLLTHTVAERSGKAPPSRGTLRGPGRTWDGRQRGRIHAKATGRRGTRLPGQSIGRRCLRRRPGAIVGARGVSVAPPPGAPVRITHLRRHRDRDATRSLSASGSRRGQSPFAPGFRRSSTLSARSWGPRSRRG